MTARKYLQLPVPVSIASKLKEEALASDKHVYTHIGDTIDQAVKTITEEGTELNSEFATYEKCKTRLIGVYVNKDSCEWLYNTKLSNKLKWEPVIGVLLTVFLNKK